MTQDQTHRSLENHDALSLIERLEKATGPNRELFEQAFFAAFGKVPKYDSDAMARWIWFSRLLDAGAWTDAALTLVPENAAIHEMGHISLSDRRWHVAIAIPGNMPQAIHATPAIALCIAALKARVEERHSHE